MATLQNNLYGGRDVSELVNRINQLERISSGNIQSGDESLFKSWKGANNPLIGDALLKNYMTNANGETVRLAGSERDRLMDEYNNLLNQSEGSRQKDQLEQQRTALTKQADQFDANKGEIEGSLIGQAGDTARTDLLSELQNARGNANARGMLYSGGLAGTEGNLIANSEKGLMGKSAAISKNVRDVGNQLRDSSINAGLQNQELALNNAKQAQALQDSAYEQRLNQMNNQFSNQDAINKMYERAGQSIGTVAGTLYGKQSAKDPSKIDTTKNMKTDPTVLGGR